MQAFRYYTPVAVYFGRDCVSTNRDYLTKLGKKAFIITCRFVDGCHNYALEDVVSVFEQEKIEYMIDDMVQENPSVESVVRLTNEIREFSPDFLVAIGGGSTLDTAKAANVLLGFPEDYDTYKAFFSKNEICATGVSEGILPSVAIPTIAGNGSEVMGYAVLTRADTDTKLGMNQMSFFGAAFLDYRYIKESPKSLLYNGALDALAHGVEGYLHTKSNFANRQLSDIGFQLFSEFKDRLLNDELADEDYEKMLLAGSIQGMSCQQVPTTLPHGMGYPLAHEKNMYHGQASCITLGHYLKSFKDEKNLEDVRHIIKKCGFSSVDEFTEYIDILVNRTVEFEVTEEEITRWSEALCEIDSRMKSHPEPITVDEVRNIYRCALASYIS